MQLDLAFRRDEPPPPRVLTVSELTRAVRELIEGGIGEVWVRGEISNHRRQASGHQYFTLKDAASQLACVLFGGAARQMPGVRLGDGMEVQAFGELSVYEARGQYQLVVRLIQEAGVGALQAKFEALKARLAAEGLFDAARKRPLPAMPRRIGVVTSPTGAAIRDFLHVLRRRMPGVDVIIHPVRVQGRGAAAEIAAALREFGGAPATGLPEVDVIVLTRGGGSIEDLWEFNEEVVARAIAASPIPVVSAVGHEIDFTISDFAADLRAPTPSAAAEILVPDAAELRRTVAAAMARLTRECREAIRFQRTRLAALGPAALGREPARVLREHQQTLDARREELDQAAAAALRSGRERVTHAFEVLRARRPDHAVAMLRDRGASLAARLQQIGLRCVTERRTRLAALRSLLVALSPGATLDRGFTITLGADGAILRSAGEAADGVLVTTRFADGEMRSVVRREGGSTRD